MRMSILLILISMISIVKNAQSSVEPNSRIDCHPDPRLTKDECINRGCTYDEDVYVDKNIPLCYYPPNTGYIAESDINSDSVSLKKSINSVKNPYGSDFDELIFLAKEIGNGIYITISPKNVIRYRPPVPINNTASISSPEKLQVVKNNASIFSFSIQRQSTGEKIWDTSIGGLLFADKYIQIATLLPTDKIYGFGEAIHWSLKHNLTSYTTWSMWARDMAPISGVVNYRNLYGVHPFYLGLEADGKAHGVFIFNSNAQEVTTGPAPHLTYRTIGGQLELFFFPGPTPEEVIQQYMEVIGKPFLPAYWALGFHICRYTYRNTSELIAVYNRTVEAGIPLDVMWADIDYMEGYKDFTLSNKHWADFPNFTNYLHDMGLHVMLIFDPAIEVDYDSFQRGIEQNASFIEWPNMNLVPQSTENQYPLTNGTKIMLGHVWPPKHVAFPDFLDPTGQTTQWWVEEFAKFRQLVNFDGIWIDMNEPSNFETSYYNETFLKTLDIEPLKCPLVGNDSEYDNPPYWTRAAYQFGNGHYLFTATLCLCGTTMRGTEKLYNTKNLYGWSETVASNQAHRQAIGKRGAVISRSTFPSSGRYGGHWTGDVSPQWADLRTSVIAIQEFNLFGIPFVGADICGFKGPTMEELCLRWQQLGAFYPFMRNHNDIVDPPGDPGVWPDVAQATRKANLFRYRHMPYLYSLLFSASLKGGTVARPVFFEFPNDPETHELSFQFLWDHALMIIPVLYENATSVNGYLPINAVWYSVYDYFYGTQMKNGWNNFTAPKDYLIPVFVRGGYILPRQKPSMSTNATRQNELQILIALDSNISPKNFYANGELYWDDGETLVDEISTYNYYHFDFNFATNSTSAALNITMTKSAINLQLQTLDNIEIFGYPYNPNLRSAKLNGNPITINTLTSSYSPFTKILNITTPNFINLNKGGPSWILTWDNL